MAAKQSEGFELFTKTFQEQYSIDPSMLRGVAWEVWQNELSEQDRQVWERMAAPEPAPEPEKLKETSREAAKKPEPAPKAEPAPKKTEQPAKKAAAHKPPKAAAPAAQKAKPKAAPQPEPQAAPARKAAPPVSAAKPPEPAAPDKKPAAPTKPEPVSAKKPEPAPSPEAKSDPSSESRPLQPKGTNAAAASAPAAEKPAAKQPQPARQGSKETKPEARPEPEKEAAPSAAEQPAKARKPSAAKRLGGMFASLKWLGGKHGKDEEAKPAKAGPSPKPSKEAAAAPPEATVVAKSQEEKVPETPPAPEKPSPPPEPQAGGEAAGTGEGPEPGSHDDAGPVAKEKSSEAQGTQQESSSVQKSERPPDAPAEAIRQADASEPGEDPEKVRESGFGAASQGFEAEKPPERGDAGAEQAEELSEEQAEEGFFLESDTLQPPHDAAPSRGDILKDVLSYQPDESMGISEELLITPKPRDKSRDKSGEKAEPKPAAGSAEAKEPASRPASVVQEMQQEGELEDVPEEQVAASPEPGGETAGLEWAAPEAQAVAPEAEEQAAVAHEEDVSAALGSQGAAVEEAPDAPVAGAASGGIPDQETGGQDFAGQEELLQDASDFDLDQVLSDEDTHPSHLLDDLGDTTPPVKVGAASQEDEAAEAMEIEPIDEGDLSQMVVDESAASVGPMPGRMAAERALARFRAAAEMEEEQVTPDFLVEEASSESDPAASLGAAQEAAGQRLAAYADALGEALLQRALQGDAVALRLCIQHVLPDKLLAGVRQALAERALQIGVEEQPSLLALLAGKHAPPIPGAEQAAAMADSLAQQALDGDLAAMELCLKLGGNLREQPDKNLEALTEKLLHRALGGDVLLLALFLERLSPVYLSEEDTQLLHETLLSQCEKGEETSLKACLASLLDED